MPNATTGVPGVSGEAILAAAARVRRAGPSAPRAAPDPVSLPVIRAWADAIGDASPVYTDAALAAASVHGGLVAPPAMIQAWTMPGLRPPPAGADGDPLGVMTAVLDQAGYTSVVATNCDQSYARYLRHGEQLSVRAELLDVTGPKATALGEGWFVTTRSTWYSAGEPVATMDFRLLKFRPAAAVPPAAPAAPAGLPAGPVMVPPASPDTEFFWAGTRAGELRIQRCGRCGTLRHPPGPACPSCGAIGAGGYQVAAGTGTVYSYVVHHHPPVPGRALPVVVALVQLPEGVRVLGELTGAGPGQVRIGMPVRVGFEPVTPEVTLPCWRPDPPGSLPALRLEITPTVIVAAALATRDFYPVHHDRDFAVAGGSKDIFLNILTTTGLVQRYVTDWAGPDALVRGVSVRLGVPCYAGDTLTFSGTAAGTEDGGQLVTVTGRCSLGSHVTGTVRLAAPPGSPA